jgi:hypothetical protein
MNETEQQFMKLDILLLKLALAFVFITGSLAYLNGCDERREMQSNIQDLTSRMTYIEQRK